MTYQPTFRKQADGSRCQWQNCNCASSAMATDRHRLGVDPVLPTGWLPMPAEIRQKISTAICRGTSHNENRDACKALYGVTLEPRYDVPWATFQSLIISGRGAATSIRYSVIHGTKYDACPTFYGGHDIYVNERRASDGAYLVSDPLADGRRAGIPKGPQWWPGSLLKAAAAAWTGAGLVDAMFTRDTEV